jgi:hypothetical protein
MTHVIAPHTASSYDADMNLRLTFARRTTQVLCILVVALIPVFDVFRYDTATKELFLFGKVWGLG